MGRVGSLQISWIPTTLAVSAPRVNTVVVLGWIVEFSVQEFCRDFAEIHIETYI